MTRNSMRKGSGGNNSITACDYMIFIGKPTVFTRKHTGFFYFAGFAAGPLTPGLTISRILTREGAAVPGEKPRRDLTPPPVGLLSSGKQAFDLRALSSGHGSACTAHASCSGPRTAPHHRDEERCGRRRSLGYTCRASCTPRRADASAETACWLSATPDYSLGSQPTVLLPDAMVGAGHSTWYRTGPAQRSRDVCTAPSVW